jgi:hypothetical protein
MMASSPSGAKATDGLFEDDHTQRRVASQKFSRGPQSGKAAAHDGDVHVQVALQGRPRGDGTREGGPP